MTAYLNNKETVKLETLPQEVQDEVKSILKYFDEANVTYEDGKYIVSPDVSIAASKAADYKVIGTFYTEKEETFRKNNGWKLG